MNFQILSAEIVRRVQHSPDTALNLEETVANLIRAEHHRAMMMEHEMRLAMMRESDRLRSTKEPQ